jgi:regulator of replication initiation timing
MDMIYTVVRFNDEVDVEVSLIDGLNSARNWGKMRSHYSIFDGTDFLESGDSWEHKDTIEDLEYTIRSLEDDIEGLKSDLEEAKEETKESIEKELVEQNTVLTKENNKLRCMVDDLKDTIKRKSSACCFEQGRVIYRRVLLEL